MVVLRHGELDNIMRNIIRESTHGRDRSSDISRKFGI